MNFRRLGADPFFINRDLSWAETEPPSVSFRDQIYKEMTDQILQKTCKALGVPPMLLEGDSNYAGRASTVVTPNENLPLGRGPWKTEIAFKECEFMMVTRARKRPCTNRRQLWRKWEKTRTITVPDPNVYVIGGFWCGHPDTIRKLISALEMLEKSRKEINPLDGGLYLSIGMKLDDTLMTVTTE